jgi:hypothetical protein|tara:strand:- start:748 stop:954 length:207 start_codon:yes stop_codon:yes gene_type:complete
MMTLTYTETQAKVNENYKLRQENLTAKAGIRVNSDVVVLRVLADLIAKNNIIISANNHIMANYVTIVN